MPPHRTAISRPANASVPTQSCGCSGAAAWRPSTSAQRADGIYSQQVALKLIPCEVSRADAVERFARERQILALLSHPNIARLLDGGVDSAGRSYIAMEYVDGEPIDGYCTAHRLLARIADRRS